LPRKIFDKAIIFWLSEELNSYWIQIYTTTFPSR